MAHKYDAVKRGRAAKISEGQNEQQMTKKKNEKERFDEWLKPVALSRKDIPDKKLIFSEEMLKAIDSVGQDISSWGEYLDKAKLSFDMRMSNPKVALAKKTDFKFLNTLGTGAFGKVLQVKHVDTKTYYAAKLLLKAHMVNNRLVHLARSEKSILQSIRFVFTVRLKFFFQDNVYLYFVLPYMAGGELFTYLTKVKRLEENDARFYTAQMFLALEYLHYIGLIFRDLKSENILMDSIGYLKLADFGLCKAIDLRTYTFCGTIEYLAPEILSSKGYGKSADWWSFGVLLYELCAGYTPFYANMQAKICENISRCKYRFPYHFSSDLKDLIKNILQLDLSRRFGNLRNGVYIKQHKFYNNISWIMLLNREITAPYIPVITRPDDTSHFVKLEEKPLLTASVDLYYKEFADF